MVYDTLILLTTNMHIYIYIFLCLSHGHKHPLNIRQSSNCKNFRELNTKSM